MKNPCRLAEMLRCEVCGVSVSGERNFEMHLKGKKHRLRLERVAEDGECEVHLPLDKSFSSYLNGKHEVPDIAPGEPIPPGLEDIGQNFNQVQDDVNAPKTTPVIEEDLLFAHAELLSSDSEHEVETVCQIQAELDACKSTLIGLDFIVEATVRDEPENSEYFCLLCDKKGPKRIVLSHVTTINHQIKFLKVLFPAVARYINKQTSDQEGRKAISRVVSEVCAKIEERCGRPKPTVIERDLLIARKSYYYGKITRQHNFRTKGLKLSEILELEDDSDEENQCILVGEVTVIAKEMEPESSEDLKQKKIEKSGHFSDDADDIQVIRTVLRRKQERLLSLMMVGWKLTSSLSFEFGRFFS